MEDKSNVSSSVIESEVIVEKNNDDCLFITENSRFDIIIRYNDEDGKLSVADVDEFFVANEKTKSITITLKYPSQGDYDTISNSFSKGIMNMNKEFDLKDFINLEIMRFLTLVRKWSLGKTLSNDAIMQLHPKIVKAALINIRNNIQMEGIL